MVQTSGELNKLAKLPMLPSGTWAKLQTLPGPPTADADAWDFDDLPPPPMEPVNDTGTRAHRGHVRGVDLRAWFDLGLSVQRQLAAEDAFVPFAGEALDVDGEDLNAPDGDDEEGNVNDGGDEGASPARVRQRQHDASGQGGGHAVDGMGGVGHRVGGGAAVLDLFRRRGAADF